MLLFGDTESHSNFYLLYFPVRELLKAHLKEGSSPQTECNSLKYMTAIGGHLTLILTGVVIYRSVVLKLILPKVMKSDKFVKIFNPQALSLVSFLL
jgi:hypothetical protein